MIYATIVFDLISIIFIIIALLALFIGIKRGFLSILVSFLKGIVSFIVAAFLTKPLALLLQITPIGKSIAGKFIDSFADKGEGFNTIITEANKDEVISSCLRQIKIPKLLDGTIIKATESYFDASANQTVAEVLSNSITYYVLVCISFLLLLLIVRIVAILLNKLLNALKDLPVVGPINAVLGGILYLFMGVLLICLISYGFTFFVSFDGGLGNWISNTLTLNDDTKTCLAEFIYNKNFLLKFIAFIMNMFS